MSNYKLARITLKHGNKEDLPELCLGEPAYCKDTGDLYIGNEKGTPPTRIGSISEEQLEALENMLNEALNLAKKTSATVQTDILQGSEKVGSISIDTSGVHIRDINGGVAFSTDPSLITYIRNLRVDSLNLTGNNSKVIMPVSRLYNDKTLTYYVSTKPKGKGDGTSRDNACSSFNDVAAHVFKEYGYVCAATKIRIWVDPGVYAQDMSIPHFPGNVQELEIYSDVNGTTTFTKPVHVYCSNCSIGFNGNSKGVIKFTSVSDINLISGTTVKSGVAVHGSNVNVGFSYCHWVTPITSQYKKYCIYITSGSRLVNFTFNKCDFYGYDALIYKGERHGEMILHNCVGDLNSWTDLTSSGNPCNNSLGLRIYIAGTYPMFTIPENALADIIHKGTTTPTHSSYYNTTTDPGGSGEVIEPPATTETWVNREERYTLGSPGTNMYSWWAKFSPKVNPSGNPTGAIYEDNGSSQTEYLRQGSLAVADTRVNEIIYYCVEWGTWAFDLNTMKYFHELGRKEMAGEVSNLTAKLVFTQQFYKSTVSNPRIIYPAKGIDIQNYMATAPAYYVTQQGNNTSDGRPTFVLEFDGTHELASRLKNDLFYTDSIAKSRELYDLYGDDAYYGIQIGSYKNPEHGWYNVELMITYKEKATIIG